MLQKLFNNAYLLLILAPLAWGGNAVAGKIAAGNWLPFTITSLRWLLVCLLLLPFVYSHLKNERALLVANAPKLFALGGLGLGGFNLLMYLALNYTTAVNVSIEQATMPCFILLLNFILLRQRVMWQQLCGLAIAVAGVWLTTARGHPLQLFESGLNRGDAIMLLACVFYAAYSVGLRWKPAISWHSFMFSLGLSAFLVSLPFTAFELWQRDHPAVGFSDGLVLTYVVIFPSLLAQVFFARGVELLGANRAGQFINLVPIFGALLAVLLLGESFHWYHGAGLALVLGGITLAERITKKPA